MTLPETIAVRFTDEEAGYISVRPVVKQLFRMDELLDLIVSVTGKNAARVRQILQAGSVVFHAFRYQWDGFAAGEAELATAMARFPDPEPSRPFRADDCDAAALELSGSPQRHAVEIGRKQAAARRWLKRSSLWDKLMELAVQPAPAYVEYSYARKADVYAIALAPEESAKLAREATELAPRSLRSHLAAISEAARILYFCRRR